MTLGGDGQRRGTDCGFPYFKSRTCFKCPAVSCLLTVGESWTITFLLLTKLEAVRVIICHLLSTGVQLLKSPLEGGRKLILDGRLNVHSEVDSAEQVPS